MQPLWQLLSAELSNVHTVHLVRNTALLLDDCILASQGMKSLICDLCLKIHGPYSSETKGFGPRHILKCAEM